MTTESTARRSDAERNVESIIDAAIACLSERGDAAMGDIAARAGVGRATLYRHFPSRLALLTAIHERAVDEAENAVLSTRPEEDTAGEALERLIVALAGVIERYRVLSQFKDELGEKRKSDVIRGYVVSVIERGQSAGEFSDEMPAGQVAEMLKGMLMSACSGGDPVAAGEFVAGVFVRGMSSSPVT